MVKYVEPAQLATWLQQDASKYLVIDVRDDDYEIGKVNGSVNVPYCDLHGRMQELVKLGQNYSAMIFHCHFSARRGPSAASIVEDELTRQGLHSSVEIYVLRGGFERWHRLYHKDSALYEQL